MEPMFFYLRPTAIILYAALLYFGECAGQVNDDLRHLYLENITPEDGLPQGMVLKIMEDRNGFMWICTKDGLTHWDGYTFTTYRNDPADPNSPIGDHGTGLLEDSQGNIWYSTLNEGLNRFDPIKGIWTRVVINDNTAQNSITSPSVTLTEGPEGRIWMHSVERELATVVDYNGSLNLVGAGERFAGIPVLPEMHTFQFDQVGRLWLASRDSVSIYQLNRTKATAEKIKTLQVRSYNLLRDSIKGRMLIADRGIVVMYDEIEIQEEDRLIVPPAIGRIYFSRLTSNGALWSDPGHEGIHKLLDLQSGRMQHIKMGLTGSDACTSLPRMTLECEDKHGNLWFGSNSYGLFKLNKNSFMFSVRKDRVDGYFLTQRAYRSHGLEVSAFVDVQDYKQTYEMEFTGLTGGKILGARVWYTDVKDPAGRRWVLTKDSTLLPKKLGYFINGTYHDLNVRYAGNSMQNIFPGHGDDIWLMSQYSNDIRRLDTKTMAIIDSFLLPVINEDIYQTDVTQWALADDGTVWMSSRRGLLQLPVRGGRKREYIGNPGDTTALPTNSIFSFCPDPKEPEKYLWVGTGGGGLSKLNKVSGECVTFTTKHGLPNNVIYGVLPDSRGNLWLSTNAGLCWFDQERLRTQIFTHEDGLMGNEFNRTEAAILEDGRLYFGGVNGSVTFDPEDFYHVKPTSRNLITAVNLLSGPAFSDLGDLTQCKINDSTIVFDHDEELITFRFASNDLTKPAANKFRYKLEGYSSDWVVSDRNEASFTNLDPGTYTFKIQGWNSDQVLDSQGDSLTFTIATPWWGTWWFRSIVILVSAGAIYLIYQNRIRQRIRLLEMREQIARDLHDDIGSTLSSISLYSAVAGKRIPEKDQDMRGLLHKISTHSDSVLETMNDIVWAINSENDDVGHLIDRIKSYATELSNSCNQRLGFDFEKEVQKMQLDMEQRKNLYLIAKEAINNAVKYSNASKIMVHINKTDKGYCLSVVDNGIGFDTDVVAQSNLGGNGIGNMRKRAADMNGDLSILSTPESGTRVELLFQSGRRKNWAARSIDEWKVT